MSRTDHRRPVNSQEPLHGKRYGYGIYGSSIHLAGKPDSKKATPSHSLRLPALSPSPSFFYLFVCPCLLLLFLYLLVCVVCSLLCLVQTLLCLHFFLLLVLAHCLFYVLYTLFHKRNSIKSVGSSRKKIKIDTPVTPVPLWLFGFGGGAPISPALLLVVGHNTPYKL